MELNKIEFWAMNNPIRRISQRYLEFRSFEKFILKKNLNLSNSVILDAGCGSGFSSKIISKKFSPKELISFDYMPEQIKIAKKKNPYAKYYVDDITNIKQPREKFDAVFVFGILHHVPAWKKAVSELYRVIRKDGYLFICEVNDKGVIFVDKYLRFHHPKEARFSWQEFANTLVKVNFIIEDETKLVFDYFRSYVCRKG